VQPSIGSVASVKPAPVVDPVKARGPDIRAKLVPYGLAAAAAGVAGLIAAALANRIAEAPPLLFVLAVLFSAWYGGLGPALLCTAIAACAIDYWFIYPPATVDLTPGTLLRVGVFAAVSATVSQLTVARRRAALARSRTNDELEQRVAERTAALERAANALLEERSRFAREIHDHLAQGLTGVLVQLAAAKQVLANDTAAAERHIATARSLAKESLEEARRSVWALRPQALEGVGLAQAIGRVLEQMTTGTAVPGEMDVRGAARPLAPNIEDDLLSICKEALANALRHSTPASIRVELLYGETEVVLTVTDDGAGFEVSDNGSGGFGLRSMRERAARMGGSLRLTSGAGRGTTVSASAPVPSA
jgi:signal transduction histidine kinase